MTMITKPKIEEFLDNYLTNGTVEELLEEFDVSIYEAFEVLFDNGLIDEDLLDTLLS